MLDDLVPGEARRFDINVHIENDVYAIGVRCTHQDASLAEGEVFTADAEIECVRHGSIFSLATGEPRCLPATDPTPVYDVRIVDRQVHVELGT